MAKRDPPRDLLGIPRTLPEADWATIDWVHSSTDTGSESAVRRPKLNNNGRSDRPVQLIGEAFIAALVCGLVLGCLGVFCDACSQWVNTIRAGVCSRYVWLGPRLCCVGGEPCDLYRGWGDVLVGKGYGAHGVVDFIMYVLISVLAAVTASYLCTVYAPYASGGGIAEVKTIVSGHHVRRYLGGWTLATKVVSTCLSTGSGLVVGKEGPFVHIGACIGDMVSRLFPRYRSENKRRELITAGVGGGIAVAFGAPVGGVIFALEEVSASYNFKALMATLVCGLTATLFQSHIDLWHTGRIVQFRVNYQHNWHFFELPCFALIGAFGGFAGSLFNCINLRLCRWRRAHLKDKRVTEVAIVAVITAVANFVTPYGSAGLLDLLGDCFQVCTPQSGIELCHDTELRSFLFLILTATTKWVLFVYSIGIFLPGGILVPALTIGALFGRSFGILLGRLQETYPRLYFFRECVHQDICIVPGLYAVVGAAALLTGVSRMAICLAIIMFELTGSLEYLIPVIIGILCAKAASEGVGVEGIYEMGIRENELPYLDPKKEFHLGFTAADVYGEKCFTWLTAYGHTVGHLRDLLHRMTVTGFPVVESEEDRTVLGYAPVKKIVRALQLAASRDSRINLNTRVRFKDKPSATAREDAVELEVNLTGVVESSMIQVEPSCPVKKMLYLFKCLGMQHVMVCRHSQFEGFVSKKDLITFMRMKERVESMEDAELERERYDGVHHQELQPSTLTASSHTQ